VCNEKTRQLQPRWGRLYAIVAGGAFGTALARSGLPVSPLRAAALVAIPALVALALAWWAATNRVALELIGWCDCAGGTVTVRVVGAESVPRIAAPPAPAERTTLPV
jgi:hypothetical protein